MQNWVPEVAQSGGHHSQCEVALCGWTLQPELPANIALQMAEGNNRLPDLPMPGVPSSRLLKHTAQVPPQGLTGSTHL